jgi:undecaprenyl diphosphate synthase
MDNEVDPDMENGRNSLISEEELLASVRKGPLPSHVAIIMDGNGRWAEQRYLPRVAGHREGIHSVREVLTLARELNIKFLTIYAFSLENWRRPQDEIDELMILLETYLRKEVKTLMEHQIRFRTIGRTDQLPRSVVRLIKKVEQQTAQNKEMVLTTALSYGGRAEIVDAAARIAEDVESGKISSEKIDETLFSQYLYTTDLPDPDLMIRTSGETRISNFLLWQLAYTELYFTKTLWPDFRRKDFLMALYDYQQRERRFGLVSEQIRRGG